MNRYILEQKIKELGGYIKEGLSKGRLEAIYNTLFAQAGFVGPDPRNRKLLSGNTWLLDFDNERVGGTFSLMRMWDRRLARGKPASLIYTDKMVKYQDAINIYARNWRKKLLNQSNTKYLLSENEKGFVYMPAVGGLGGNQVKILGGDDKFSKIEGLSLKSSDWPEPKEAINLPHLFHIYAAWNGKNLTYPAGYCFQPLWKFADEIYIENRLLKL